MGVIAGFPQMRFCDAPTQAATTRLNLNRVGVSWRGGLDVLAGLGLGVPAVLGEPGSRVREYGLRTLALPLRAQGSKADAVHLLGLVARELVRPTNWLEFWLDEQTGPRWFRTFAASSEQVSLDDVYVDPRWADYWTTSLSVPAEPFAYGTEQTLWSGTVTNHPASGVNPMRVTLNEVLGEAPAPLRVKVTKAGAGGMLGPAIGCSRVSPVVVGSPTWGGAVGGAPTDSSMVSGARRATSGVSSSAWSPVATWAPGAVPAGVRRWAPLMRVAGSSNAGAFHARLRVQAAGVSSVVYTDVSVLQVRQQARWVRVGDVPCPLVEASGLGASASTTVTLEVRRAIAGGELHFDGALLMVPAGEEDQLLALAPDVVGTGAVSLLVDGRDTAMVYGSSPMRAPGVTGAPPAAVPGQSNVMTLLQTLEPTLAAGYSDSITSTTSVEVRATPRYWWGV